MSRQFVLACSTVALLAGQAAAQDVSVGGALDLRIGFDDVDFEIEYVDEDFGFGEDGPRSWFFNQDAEIQFEASGVADALNLAYGAVLELEVDTGDGENARWDEAYIFLESDRFGYLLLGEDDDFGDRDSISFNASTVARGTGGVDGDQRTAPEFFIGDSGEATKLLYMSPRVFGLLAGVSYAVNAGDRGSVPGSNDEPTDATSLALNYRETFAGIDVGGYAGLSRATVVGAHATNWAIGGLIGYAGIEVAGYYGDEDTAFAGDDLDDRPRENMWNIGIGTDIGNYGVSFNFQKDNYLGEGEKTSYILGGDRGILPGVALRGEIAYQDQKRDAGPDVDGLNALIQTHVSF